MNIAVIGAGNVGTALAKRLKPQGHDLMLSYSRDKEKLRNAAKSLGVPRGSPAEAVRWGKVVALTVPWSAVPDALTQAGDLAEKTLWDCTNPTSRIRPRRERFLDFSYWLNS